MANDLGDVQLRFAADESPPLPLAMGFSIQSVILVISSIVLTPVIVIRAAGHPLDDTSWAVFAALIVCGITTVVQARPVSVPVLGQFGAGFVLFMGTSGAFLAISIDAVRSGGLALLATLVLFSSLIQFLFSVRLGHLRKIVTPTVGGAVSLMIAVAVFPVVLDMLNTPLPNMPKDSIAGPVTATITFGIIVGVSLFAKGAIRLWSPLLGIVIGCITAYAMGAFDFTQVREAGWVGLPEAGWPGLDMSFSIDFWRLLIPFAIVTVIGAIETYGDGISIQRISTRGQNPIDFRAVQGAVNADGLGNFLSGILGTLPNTTSSNSLSVVSLTGVAARSVGVVGGMLLFLIAFCPKVSALLTSIPLPIAAAYIMILLVLLFIHGLREVASDGLGFENGMIVCLSFWLAVGFQDQAIFHDFLPLWSLELLDNGMTAGSIFAVLLASLMLLKSGRTRSLQVPVALASVSEIQAYLAQAGARAGWDRSAILGLELAGEEAMLFLMDETGGEEDERKVRVTAREVDGHIEIEILSGPMESHLEASVRGLDRSDVSTTDDVGLRVLTGIAHRVRHEKFYGVDVLILTMDSRPL